MQKGIGEVSVVTHTSGIHSLVVEQTRRELGVPAVRREQQRNPQLAAVDGKAAAVEQETRSPREAEQRGAEESRVARAALEPNSFCYILCER